MDWRRLVLAVVVAAGVSGPAGADAPRLELEKRIEEFQNPTPRGEGEGSGVGSSLMPTTKRSDEEIRRTSDWSKRSREVLRSLRPVAAGVSPSVGEVRADGKETGYATVVREDGILVTKASEIQDREGKTLASLTVRVGGGPVALPAKVLGVSAQNDLAVLKVEQQGLTPVRWAPAGEVKAGQVVFAPDASGNALAMGVVSVGRRGTSGGMLGVGLSNTAEGVVVGTVLPDSPAQRAGIQTGDVLLAINDQEFADLDDLRAFLQLQSAGTEVAVTLERKVGETTETIVVHATLALLEREPTTRPVGPEARANFQDTIGGPLSRRRTNFPAIYQHDVVLQPGQQGGPLVDLQGRVIGVNIARSGRVETLALPADVVEATVAEVVGTAKEPGGGDENKAGR